MLTPFLRMQLAWENNNKIKVIVVQGPSTAGKTYLSSKLIDLLNGFGKRIMVVSLDDYYNPRPKHAQIYDFDNPAALNWRRIIDLIRDINDLRPVLRTYKYSFEGSRSIGPILVSNPYPEYLIIEGIYALYLFSDIFFDLPKYNPQNNTPALFVPNPLSFGNMSAINILMTTCKKRMYEIRLRRDMSERGKSKDMVIFQLDNQTWPATEKWVYNKKLKVDILFWHGSFNERRMENFFSALKSYVKKEKNPSVCAKSYFCHACGKYENDHPFFI